MNRETVEILNRINRGFYDAHAEEFSATRRSPWPGWQRLLEVLPSRYEEGRPLSVLDLGCGNGRFGRFLSRHWALPFSYLGLDASETALLHARKTLSSLPSVRLIHHDLLAGENDAFLPQEAQGPFSLIAVFGLLHHVPGELLRQALLAELARRLEDQGILALSVWQFGRFERFRKKAVSWKCFTETTGIAVDLSQLEPGDCILTWGGSVSVYRYCHFIDSEECSRLLGSLRLECFETYTADGATGTLNRYHLMRKRSESGTGF